MATAEKKVRPDVVVTANHVTEILVVGGERFRVQGAPEEVENKIVDASRGSILELVSLAEAESGEPIALNPEHIVAITGHASTTQGG
jgi:uncharacterized protein YlzI (FlbEa/FlbD family)